MIAGMCPRCGRRYYGWSLREPLNQSCAICGTGLLITEDGDKIIRGYSPFVAEEYKINLYSKTVPDSVSSKNKAIKE